MVVAGRAGLAGEDAGSKMRGGRFPFGGAPHALMVDPQERGAVGGESARGTAGYPPDSAPAADPAGV